MKSKILLAAAGAFVASMISTSASAVSITGYSNDFDGGVTTAPGVTALWSLPGAAVQSSQGYSGVGGFSGNFLSSFGTGGVPGNTGDLRAPSQATLTLSNLPTHTDIDITGLIAAIDSWDSTNGTPAPDLFEIVVDGVIVFSDTYNNGSGSTNNGQGLLDIGSGEQDRGFLPPCCGGLFGDQGFSLGGNLATIVHSATTLTIDIFGRGAGWQFDEDWGLDNLVVTLNGVPTKGPPPTPGIPEPGTLSLLGFGLAGLGWARRRKRV